MSCGSVGEGRKKSQLAEPASSDYTLGGNDVDMTGIVGNFRTPNGASEQCLLKKLPNGKLGEIDVPGHFTLYCSNMCRWTLSIKAICIHHTVDCSIL